MIRLLQQFTLSLAVVLTIVYHVCATTIVDDFSDGGVVLNATEETVLHDGAASAIGGWRAISFLSNPGSSTLSLDDNAGTLGTTTTGLTSTVLGYGYRVDNTFGLIGTAASALNADLSGFVGLRFHVLENPVVISETKMRLQVMLSTSGGGSSSTGLLPAGTLPASGAFDLPFDSIPTTSFGGVTLTDVDRILITIRNGVPGNPLTIGRIELVPIPEPASLALGSLGVLGVLSRRTRRWQTRYKR